MRRLKIAELMIVGVLLTGLMSCEDDNDDVSGPSNAPSSHTISKDGVRHLDGLQEPFDNCTTCHGSDLRGGDGGQPSCYLCHGQEWS